MIGYLIEHFKQFIFSIWTFINS